MVTSMIWGRKALLEMLSLELMLVNSILSFCRACLRHCAIYRDPVFRPFVHPLVHTFVCSSTFVTTLVSTLLSRSITLKPYEILWHIKHYQMMWLGPYQEQVGHSLYYYYCYLGENVTRKLYLMVSDFPDKIQIADSMQSTLYILLSFKRLLVDKRPTS